MNKQEIYEKKKSIIEEMQKYETYSLYNFNPDEVLTEDFVSFVKEMKNDRLDFNIYTYYSLNNKMFNNVDSFEIADNYFNLILKYFAISNKAGNINNLDFYEVSKLYDITKDVYFKLKNKYVKEYALKKLLTLKNQETNKPLFKDSDLLDEKIDHVIINESIEDVKAFIKCLDENYTYKNLSLALNNPKLDNSIKKEIIKASYKKSQFSKYKEKFRETMKNFDDLVIFIESCIEENPKVKDVDKEVATLFKNTFIAKNWGDRSDLQSIMRKLQKNGNTDYDSRKKLREKYFEREDFVDMLASITNINDYSYRRYSFKSLLNTLYNGSSIDEILNAVYKMEKYEYDFLISDLIPDADELEYPDKDKILKYKFREIAKKYEGEFKLINLYDQFPYSSRENLYEYFIQNHVDDTYYQTPEYKTAAEFSKDLVFIMKRHLYDYNDNFKIPAVFKDTLGFTNIYLKTWSNANNFSNIISAIQYIIEGSLMNLKNTNENTLKFIYNNFFKDLDYNKIRNIGDVVMQELSLGNDHEYNPSFSVTPALHTYAMSYCKTIDIKNPGKIYFICLCGLKDAYKHICGLLNIEGPEVENNIKSFEDTIKSVSIIGLII